MTEKELRKLNRSDFLQLLLAQGKDMSAVQTRLDEKTHELELLQADNESLKAKMYEKDELIEKLVGNLDSKDATISALQQEIEDIKATRRIELEQAGSIAMAALNLNGIFEAAQKAADQYLYNIHLMYNELGAKCLTGQAKQENSEEAEQPEQEPQALDSDPLNEAPAPNPEKKEAAPPERKIGFCEKLRMLGTL